MTMKVRILLIISLFVSFKAAAQKPDTIKECNFLGVQNFKNGKATIIVKAIYKEFYRSGDEPMFTKLEKEKKLYFRDYFTRCCGGSEIAFIPEGCSKKYSGVMIQKKMNADINHVKPGDIIYLTCIVYEGEKMEEYNIDFFTVNNISLKSTDK